MDSQEELILCHQGCGKKINRRDLAVHLEEECQKIQIFCVGKEYGCTHSIGFREDIRSHEFSNCAFAKKYYIKLNENKKKLDHLSYV